MMKKTMKYFWLLAAAAVIFSCQKETGDAPEQQPANDTEEQTSPSDPGIHALDPDEYLVGFSASLEGIESKVSIDVEEGSLSFEDGDAVLVVTESKSGKYLYNATDAVFEPEDTDQAVPVGNAKAYYPYSEFSAEGETVTFTMPEAIAAGSAEDLGDKTPMAALISSDRVAQFKNLGSILRVRLTGNRELASLELSNDNVPIGAGGNYPIFWNGSVPSITSTTSGTVATISSATTLSGEATDFYFLLPATAASMSNMKITANMASADGFGLSSYSLSRNGALALLNNGKGKIITVSFYAGLFSGGTGTSDNPFLIANARDFKNIHNYTENGHGNQNASYFLSAHYEQVADISFGTASNKGDLSEYMIGSSISTDNTKRFKGSYNGKHGSTQFTLSNFSIEGKPDSDYEGVALFKSTHGATLQNISLISASVSGEKFTAGLVGYAYNSTISSCFISDSCIGGNNNYGAAGLVGGLYGSSKVENCSATDMTIRNTSESQKNYYGGLISYCNGATTVEGCSLNGATMVEGSIGYFGGIIACSNNNNAKINTCCNTSEISGPSLSNQIGGVVGELKIGTVSRCWNLGRVTGVTNVGGVVGLLSGSGTLSESYSGAGSIIVGTSSIGGVVGRMNAAGTISDSYSESGCSINGSSSVGGVIGLMSDGTLHDSHAKATISATGQYIGGLVGYLSGGKISQSYANADVTSPSASVGGFVGYLTSAPTIDGSYSKGVVKGASSVGGFIGTMDAENGYVVNCSAGAKVIATADDGTLGAGGFVGYMRNKTNGSDAVIANCVVWSVVVKALKGSSSFRVGGFVGVHNKTTNAANSLIQNCYYRGTPSQVGYGGTEDNDPTTIAGNAYIGVFAGYSAATLNDCYGDSSKSLIRGGTSSGINKTGLPSAYIQGRQTFLPTDITTSNQTTFSTNSTIEQPFSVILNDANDKSVKINDIPLSTWNTYTYNGDSYFYPSVLPQDCVVR